MTKNKCKSNNFKYFFQNVAFFLVFPFNKIFVRQLLYYFDFTGLLSLSQSQSLLKILDVLSSKEGFDLSFWIAFMEIYVKWIKMKT